MMDDIRWTLFHKTWLTLVRVVRANELLEPQHWCAWGILLTVNNTSRNQAQPGQALYENQQIESQNYLQHFDSTNALTYLVQAKVKRLWRRCCSIDWLTEGSNHSRTLGLSVCVPVKKQLMGHSIYLSYSSFTLAFVFCCSFQVGD